MPNLTPTLYLIRGVPGSGKSTFAQQLLAAGVVDSVFEADHYFYNVDGQHIFDASKIGEAHSRCQKATINVLNRGHSVAVSNTSTTEREVEIYAKIAEECGAKFVSIIIENRHGGVNIHNVPEEKVQQMKNRFSVKL